MGEIAANLNRVQQTIAAACERAGRSPEEVTLVAVSKNRSPQEILAVAQAGVRHFGENRIEEASEKIPAVHHLTDTPLMWHMIGHIQSRKARQIPTLFALTHSIDSVKLAEKLARQARPDEKIDALLQVNVSGEGTKWGFRGAGWQTDASVRQQLWLQIQYVLKLSTLNVRGLMTMAPIVPEMEQARPVFANLAALRDALVDAFDIALPELSMGMTDDYPVAVEEGATLVRIGRAIFD